MRNCFGFLVLTTMVFLTFPGSASAFELTITNANIDAYLQPDGNVEVEESFTYEFDGEFNGVIRNLNYREESSIVNLEAYENEESLQIETEEEISHRIHRAGSDETITIDLHYTIENGVDVYNDFGEFYWPFFDSSNETDYESMTVTVHPPQSTDEVQAIGYFSADGSETISDDGTVIFSMGYVEGGTDGDVRTAFDANLFQESSNFVEGTIGDEIVSEQQDRAEQAVIYTERREMFANIFRYAIPVIALIFLLLIGREWQRNRQRKSSSIYQNSEVEGVPELMISMPATIMNMQQMATADLLAASLLDLIRKKKIEKVSDDAFRIINREDLLEHERMLIFWLFDEIGNDEVFCFADMKTFLEKEENHEKFQIKQSEWAKAVKDELKAEKLYVDKSRFRWGLGITAFLLIPATIPLFMYDLYAPVTVMISMILFVMLFALIYQPRTEKGWKITTDWRGFKQKLSNVTIQDWKKFDQEDQMKAFIFGLGSNIKNIKNMGEDLSKQLSVGNSKTQSNQSFDVSTFILVGLVFSDGFQTSTVTASSSSGSSGTIGGGTGVGGGGGGSGGF
ncbi:DUF2207 domain-containing protein [Salipaludibacillus sp. HK11]|uniref:DUF2207 domain-containing protein n=1 Tax=Salipaludibacillus sp. HK11 TaxID=3394320 RepID=UPI0039FDD587